MRELVYRKAGNTMPAQAVDTILTTFNGLPDRAGIPQRSTASSVPANAFLAPVDDVLARYAGWSGGHVARWMDDLWVFGGKYEHLRCLQLDVQDELRNLGLEINLGKTKIREGNEAHEPVEAADLERDPPEQNAAASGMPFVAKHGAEDLDRQFDLLTERPELADRTAIR
jgi:Reverse transcriptase (RNA-dependent DNA polymerase)